MVSTTQRGGGYGCHTCKNRRVKCDRTRPVCNRCSRGNFECLGYERQIRWKGAIQTSSSSSRNELQSSHLPTILHTSPRQYHPSRQLDLSAFQAEVCFGRYLDNFVWFSYGIGWLEEAITGKLGPLTYQAVKALSEMNFGRMENVSQLKLMGAQRYGQALQTMIRSVERAKAQELLLPCILLQMYVVDYPYRRWEALVEIADGPESSIGTWREDLEFDRLAALSHTEGIAKILNVCGPAAFQSTLMRNVLDCARISLACVAILSRKRIFLEEHAWRTIPWAPDLLSRSEQSRLIDILVTIPGLLEDYSATLAPAGEKHISSEKYNKASRDAELLLTNFTNRIDTQLELLFVWRWQWQRRYGSGVKLGAPAAQDSKSPQLQALPSVVFDYPVDSAVRAADISLYNALLLWILTILWNTKRWSLDIQAFVADCAKRANPTLSTQTSRRKRERDTELFNPLSVPGHSIGLRIPATEILRVFEWQSQNHNATLEASQPIPMYLHPLSMAMSLLDQEEDVKLWVEEMVGKSRHTFSFQPGAFKLNGLCELVKGHMVDPELSSSS